MSSSNRRNRRIGFWLRLPAGAYLLFLAGVFFLFASFGLIGAIGQRGTWTSVLGVGIYTGVIATGFAWLGTRRDFGWMILWALAVFVGWPLLQGWIWPSQTSNTAFQPFGFASIAAMVAVFLGYMLFLFFVSTEGRRQFRLEAEINLAGAIHRVLAPAVSQQLGRYQFAGSSHASGEVGGDLLDVVAVEGGWLAYIADVSGHGVAAGVLMGVVKSAVHTWLAARAGSDEGILPGLNRVLTALLPPESYVTLAALTPAADGTVHYAAAGHPPLLHFHAATGEVTQHGASNFPLGLFAEASFEAVPIACASGDVLAIFTDGLVEIFDRQQQEFGVEGLSAALRQAAQLPLPQAADALTAAARAFGPQTDDQTLLLLRLGGGTAAAESGLIPSGRSAAIPETVE